MPKQGGAPTTRKTADVAESRVTLTSALTINHLSSQSKSFVSRDQQPGLGAAIGEHQQAERAERLARPGRALLVLISLEIMRLCSVREASDLPQQREGPPPGYFQDKIAVIDGRKVAKRQHRSAQAFKVCGLREGKDPRQVVRESTQAN